MRVLSNIPLAEQVHNACSEKPERVDYFNPKYECPEDCKPVEFILYICQDLSFCYNRYKVHTLYIRIGWKERKSVAQVDKAEVETLRPEE